MTEKQKERARELIEKAGDMSFETGFGIGSVIFAWNCVSDRDAFFALMQEALTDKRYTVRKNMYHWMPGVKIFIHKSLINRDMLVNVLFESES